LFHLAGVGRLEGNLIPLLMFIFHTTLFKKILDL
jgi:hypothetical protein